MPQTKDTVVLATRGSALALVQTNLVLSLCQAAFPQLRFEIKIIRTTGDKLQSVPPDAPALPGTKGLFTKELEVALLAGDADLAVHSLKDLPTELPEGLELSAVLPREDVRDVLIYRDAASSPSSNRGQGRRGLPAGATLRDFPPGAILATSSTRRQAQLLSTRPDLKVIPIRGNVGTRLRKLSEQADLDGIILAAAGLKRLGYRVSSGGHLQPPNSSDASQATPEGLCATFLSVEEMVPCVGQGAIGIEGRARDDRLAPIFAHLNDPVTASCVEAERAFLFGMGGGCLSPVAAYAELDGDQIRLRAVSFRTAKAGRTVLSALRCDARELGTRAAKELATA